MNVNSLEQDDHKDKSERDKVRSKLITLPSTRSIVRSRRDDNCANKESGDEQDTMKDIVECQVCAELVLILQK